MTYSHASRTPNLVHDQGIIHRDIKPANLLWSADRRVVKIADFGISHFSYAQFLAAKGKTPESANVQEEHDKILMDESDLTRFAGTPTFLAPEIISDGSGDMSASTSTASNLQTVDSTNVEVRKPVISKAIDIWAFGITLYALLFGKLPFVAESEYLIYNKIKEEDWDVPETMGQDKFPVGGRDQKKQKKGQETEGYLVIDLLRGILEKDPSKRLTLQDVKVCFDVHVIISLLLTVWQRHPWITRDMPNADHWLRATNADENASLAPTAAETSSALSTVLFRYKFRSRLTRGISSGISSFIRNIRPQRSFRASTRRSAQPPSDEEQRYRRVGTRSMPHVELSQPQSTASAIDKGKQPMRPQGPRNKSSVDVRTSQHTKSLDRVSNTSSGFNGPDISGSGAKPRRGSAPGHALSNLETLRVPAQSSRVSSPQRSPSAHSPSTPHVNELTQDDRPRSRLSLLMRWMINKPASWAPSNQASSSTLPSGAVSPSSVASGSRPQHTRDLTQRRSEDAFNRMAASRNDGSLTQAMRAASWGEVGGYHSRPSEDMTSLYSDHAEDGPDEDTYLVGFGGVAQSPVSTAPSAVLSTVSSMGSLAPAVSISAAQILLQRAEASSSAIPPSTHDPAAQDTVFPRQTQVRAHATSPLSHHASEEDLEVHAPTFEDSDVESGTSGERTPSEQEYGPSNTSAMYQEADEESDEEAAAPLEVKTRRPSWSAHSRPVSPRRSDIGQEGCARPTIRI